MIAAKEYSLKMTDSRGSIFQTKKEFLDANPTYTKLAQETFTGQSYGSSINSPGLGITGTGGRQSTFDEATNQAWNKYLQQVNKIQQKGGIPAGPAAASINGLVNNVFQNAANSVVANQKGGDGRRYYNEMMSTILNSGIAFDGKDGILTYGGFKQSAIKDAKEAETQQKLYTILNDFNTRFNDFTKPQPAIEIGGVLFAAGEKNRAGNFIRLPKEFLDGYYNQADPKKGFLSKDEYDGLLQNGLSIMADSDKIMNSLIEGTFTSPLEAVLKYNKELNFVDPLGGHELNFTVPPVLSSGSNQYQYQSKINVYNPETGKLEEYSGWEPTFTNGQDIDGIIKDWEDMSAQINLQNQNIKYGLE
jgi:hypothetical protein